MDVQGLRRMTEIPLVGLPSKPPFVRRSPMLDWRKLVIKRVTRKSFMELVSVQQVPYSLGYGFPFHSLTSTTVPECSG